MVKDSTTYVPNHCMLDVAVGKCQNPSTNYFFNVTASSCQPFTYTGCGGNWNRFTTLADCTKSCTCTLPPETGPCKGYEERWYYSPADGYCKPFMYGGCGGNSNSYLTWHDCSEQCGYPTSNSTWRKSGAEWSNASGSKSNTTTSRDNLMRDLMLWILFANGEGFEMEDFASLLAQAYMLRYATTAGSGSTGANPLYGSQMTRQYLTSAIASGLIDADFMEGRQGASTLGMAGGRSGPFTPLGQVGSIENVLQHNNIHGTETSEFGYWDRMNAQGKNMDHFGSTNDNRIGGNLAEATMFGQGQFETGNKAMDFAASANTNFGLQPETTRRAHHSISSKMGTRMPHFEDIAMEILYYIQKMGSGEFKQSDLLNLGRKFGTVGSNGILNITLLASEMVKALRGSNASSNMASIENVAKTMGVFDNNGHINMPLFVNSLMQKMSNNRISEIFRKDSPSANEFNWLTKRADVKRTRIGKIDGGREGNFNQGQSFKGGTKSRSMGIPNRSSGVIKGVLSGGRKSSLLGKRDGVGSGETRGLRSRTIDSISKNTLLGTNREFDRSQFDMTRPGSERIMTMALSRNSGAPNLSSAKGRRGISMSGFGAPSGTRKAILSAEEGRLSGNMNGLDSPGHGTGSENTFLRVLGMIPVGNRKGLGGHGRSQGFDAGTQSSFPSALGMISAADVNGIGGRGGVQGLGGGRMSGQGGVDGLGRAFGGSDDISIDGGRGGFTGNGLDGAFGGSGLKLPKVVTVVSAGKSARMGSYGRK
ncbi:hypothetical protein ACF0H5_003333 [Mactra antiquata]